MRSNLTNKLILIGIIVCLIFFLGVNSLFASSAVLSWNPPTTNADGTQLNDLAGYKVHYGTESGNYSASIDAGNVVTYEVNNLSAGVTYYFATTAYNTAGSESQYSAEINKTFPVAVMTYYCDSDNDGYIDTSSDGSCIGAGCEPAGCQTTPGSDCNDSNLAINPETNWYQDNDGDGFGTSTIYFQQCTQPGGPINYVLDNNDYNDNDPTIDLPIKLDNATPSYYTLLQAAYDAASDGDTIKIIAGNFTEDLYIDMMKSVTFSYGYDGTFTTVLGETTLNGDLIIWHGTLIGGDFILQ